ncbi:MAG TPA: Nif3-like dinuclear metal center hexameric protein [Nitrososphaeraceae archaeon]|nr:Nif3-like dinuclear metal center hexameric protein [Nitrososphaeraceae archaeon]
MIVKRSKFKMVDTNEILEIALDMVDWNSIPADTAVHVHGKNIKKVMLMIDVTTADLMLAKNLGCDAVITHHPIGKASINFYKVIDRHIDYMIENGISEKTARLSVMDLRRRIEIRNHTQIYSSVIDSAKILNMPLVNIHQPCDEYARRMISERIQERDPNLVSEIITALEEIPEFKKAETKIQVAYGQPDTYVGKWIAVIAAGTNGGYLVARNYFENGISTVLYFHIDYNDLVKLRESNVKGNLVILGHLAGDSIGMNALGNKLENEGMQVVRKDIITV